MSMTLQEIFDTACTRLLEQGRPSIDFESDACRYRHTTESGDTLCCIVGGLIADEHYDPLMENLGPGTIAVTNALHRSGVVDVYTAGLGPNSFTNVSDNVCSTRVSAADRDRLALLKALQRVHDQWASKTGWRIADLIPELERVATAYDLNHNALEAYA